MKTSFWVGVGLFLQGVASFAIIPRQESSTPGVISAPVWRRDQTRSVENDLVRRDFLQKRATSNTVSLDLLSAANKLLYFANSTSLCIVSWANDSYDRNTRTKVGVTNRYWIQ
jgi:hypothetical protein